MEERDPFRDMLGNPVYLGDFVYRPTTGHYEKVVEIKPYKPQRWKPTYQIGIAALQHLGTEWELKPTWFKDGNNMLKVHMDAEVASAFSLLDRDISSFVPKLVLAFKE